MLSFISVVPRFPAFLLLVCCSLIGIYAYHRGYISAMAARKFYKKYFSGLFVRSDFV